MKTPLAREDFIIDLWRTLSPYLGVAQSIIVVMYLAVGGAHQAWPLVLALTSLQIVTNIVMALQSGRFKNVIVLSYTFAFINWSFCTVVVIISGGYPSLFWLTFVLGAIQSGLFIGRTGVLLNVIFAGIAMVTPRITQLTIEIAVEIGILALLLFTLGLITEKSTAMLLNERAKYKKAENELQQSNKKLVASLREQEHYTRDIAILTEMGDFLQACPDLEETYGIITHFGQQLFPTLSGAFLLYNASRDRLATAATWGEPYMESDHQVFSPVQCWALRRGQVHFAGNPPSGLRCYHLKDSPATSYVCTPMMAQGEIIGVLHLQGRMSEPASSTTADEDMAQIASLAKTAGEHIALAIANINLRETLRNQSIRDPLTDLFNRRYLEETLGREVHRAMRSQCPLGLIFMDIDNFKLFNDTLGHDVGDAILRELGAFLKVNIRYSDIACRYGGDEFVIVLPDTPLEVTIQRAEGIRTGVKSMKVDYKRQDLKNITLSLGVVAIPEIEAAAEILLQTADAALRQAKTEGRDRVVVTKTTK
jgi:diguanylate cyclase (GGDEF)-like protein